MSLKKKSSRLFITFCSLSYFISCEIASKATSFSPHPSIRQCIYTEIFTQIQATRRLGKVERGKALYPRRHVWVGFQLGSKGRSLPGRLVGPSVFKVKSFHFSFSHHLFIKVPLIVSSPHRRTVERTGPDSIFFSFMCTQQTGPILFYLVHSGQSSWTTL